MQFDDAMQQLPVAHAPSHLAPPSGSGVVVRAPPHPARYGRIPTSTSLTLELPLLPTNSP